MSGPENPRVILVTIGTELLTGKVLNTNAWFLARLFDQASFPVIKHVTVHDRQAHILSVLRSAAREAPIVVVTGGLGPTFDDITAESIALFANTPLVIYPRLFNQFKNQFKRRSHLRTRRGVNLLKRQLRLPQGCRLLRNRIGVASGFILRSGGVHIAALPGVPHEMEEMSKNELLPKLNRAFPNRIRFEHFALRMKGASEPRLLSLVPKNFFLHPHLRWGIYPMNGTVGLRVYFQTKYRSAAKKAMQYIKGKLKKYVFSDSDLSLEEVVAALLIKKHKTVSVAESVTAGGIGEALTQIPGSSRFFLGGIVAYSNRIKEKLLGVDRPILQKFGAVSKPVAIGMARGIRRLTGSDYSVSVTGIAGPGGGTRQKPVGLVHSAVVSSKRIKHAVFRLQGDRRKIRQRAVAAALSILFDELRED